MVSCGSGLLAGIFGLLAALSSLAQDNEFRALWVDAWGSGFKSASEVTTLMNDLRAGNFNAVIVQVRRRGDAFYSSNYEPRNSGIASGFDPLQDLITKGHDTTGGKQRIEIHAWITTYPISPSASPGATHPMTLHPDWLMQSDSGSQYDGTDYWFDPGHPGVQQHTFDVCMDIVSRYDVDGLNFDYVRYPSKAWGYNPATVQRFNTRFGRTGQPGNTDSAWLQFRRDQITTLVRKVYLSSIALKPGVKISADTICFAPGITTTAQWPNSAAYADKLQDWRAWMEEGILDLNLPMMYFDQTVWASAWNNWSIFAKNHRYNRHLAIGPGIYLNTISNSIVQLRHTRTTTAAGNKADGVSGYAYKTTNNEGLSRATFLNALVSPTSRDPLTPPVFGSKVNVPAMPWKSAPTTGHVKGLVRDATTGAGLDYATVVLTGPVNKNLRTDATGFFGVVDLPPGNYSLTAAQTGYLVAATNITVTIGAVASQDFNLQVSAVPTIVSQPVSQTVLIGRDATFTVAATGNPAPTYQWRFYGTNLPGATGTAYTRSNAQPAHAGNYSVLVSNSQGSVASSNAALTVVTTDSPPVLTAYPQSQVAIAGSTVTLTATAQGTAPLNFQWEFNGSPIAGATGTALLLTNIQPASTGSYRVRVSNTAGTDTSLPATVTVRYLLTLNISGAGAVTKSLDLPHYAPNASVTLTASGNQVFSGWSGSASGTVNPMVVTMNGNKVITATFTNTLVVESRQPNGDLTPNPPYSDTSFGNSTLKSGAAGLTGNGSRYGFATSTAFTVRPTLPVAGGTYTVHLTHGSASSIADDLIMSVGQTGCSGLPATTSIFQEPGGNTWELLGTMTLNPGVVTPTLTFAYASGTLSSSSSRIYSDAIRFTSTAAAAQAPVILLQPQERTVTVNSPATFSVSAAGSGPLAYQWRLNGANISGATQSSFTRSSAQTSQAGNYSVVVSSTHGSATSSNALLTVLVPVAISAQPQSQTNNPGGTTTFSVAATGTAPLGYQWRHNGANIAGATASSFTLHDLQPEDAGFYSVVINNVLGGQASSNGSLTVRLPPTILAHPLSQTVNPGESVQFSVTASGTAPLTYQWQRNGTNIAVTTSSLTLNPVQAEHAGVYTVTVSNEAGAEASDPAVLIVNAPPAILTQPENQSVSEGTDATFTVLAGGTEPLDYQWHFGGVPLPGATLESFTRPAAQAADAGDYWVVVTNVAGSITSAVVVLTVTAAQPAQLTADRLSDGRLRLHVLADPGHYRVEAAASPTNAVWDALTNVVNEAAGFEYTDPETNLLQRFYRTRRLQP